MKQTPILFSTPMVKAILDGTKTQTRRTKGLEDLIPDEDSGYTYMKGHSIQLDIHHWKDFAPSYCPYGNVGDILWVRESISKDTFNSYPIYKESYQGGIPSIKWTPSIHMKKMYARIWLEIVSVRVERVQDISEADAKAEGVLLLQIDSSGEVWKDYLGNVIGHKTAKESFRSLWQSINGAESWEANPWVWAIEFKRVEK